MQPLLLAEDDLAITHVVTEIVKGEGYSLVIATNEEEVIELASKRQPFVILLDLSLSGSDGRVIAKKLRSLSKTKRIPIVIVSADSRIEKIAKEIHADGFLMKPFDIDDFLSLVKLYVKG